MENRNGSGQRTPIVFRLVLVAIPLFVCVSCFAIAELFVRETWQSIDLNVLTGQKASSGWPNPQRLWSTTDAFAAFAGIPGTYRGEETKTVNKAGFISTPDLPVAKPPNTVRIVFLGESSTAGTGFDLADEDTWPWRTWRYVAQRFPGKRIEFINAAQGGYTSFESFGRLWSRVRFYQPDIVVMYHGWNEFYYFDQVDTIHKWRTLADGSWTIERIDRRAAVVPPHWIDRYIGRFQLLVRARLWLLGPKGPISSEQPPPAPVVKNTYDTRGLDVFRTNLRLIRDVSKTLGAELFVCKQATLMTKDVPPDKCKGCSWEGQGFDYNSHLEAFQGIYRVIDDEIDARHIIDTRPLSGRYDLFADHVHPTVLGASKIAEIVGARILETLQEKK